MANANGRTSIILACGHTTGVSHIQGVRSVECLVCRTVSLVSATTMTKVVYEISEMPTGFQWSA